MIVKFFHWDQPKNIFCGLQGIQNNDKVVVEHDWGGIFLADVLITDKNIEGEEAVGKVTRKALAQDREIILNNQEKENVLLKDVKKEVRRLEMPMKVVDVKISIDAGCLVVFFTAEGRIDFRGLVRDFSKKHHKTVRFQQIGSRDEARRIGGYGICGKEICCKKFPGSLKSISTEMARNQSISHRGSDRLSGVCGRLMCCLAFEADQYKKKVAQGVVEKKNGNNDKIKNSQKKSITEERENNKIVK